MQGNYFGKAPFIVTPFQGAQEAGFKVISAAGTTVNGTSSASFAEAIHVAQLADIIVFAGGIDNTLEREGLDRNTISWPGNQLDLMKNLASLGKPLVVVQFGGGQVDDTKILADDNVRNVTLGDLTIDKAHAQVQAIIWAGYPGQSGGTAIFDIITGAAAPAGRLPVTQYPAEYTQRVRMTDMSLRPSRDNLGRTYRWYKTPVLEYGHGLHFTSFEFSWQRQPAAEYNIQHLIRAGHSKFLDLASLDTFEICVRNAGNITSDYVGLLFLSGNSGPGPQPLKSLVAYSRAHDIQGGSSAILTLKVTLGSIARVDKDGDLWLFPGRYRLVLDTKDGVLTHSFLLVGNSECIYRFPRDKSP
jgi:beta-D-xylosidase 4